MKPKILITGPGRSGTTFLIQLVTRLGYNTGFDPYDEHYVEQIRGGCEWILDMTGDIDAQRREIAKAPQIMKAPDWSLGMKRLLSEDAISIAHVFIPVRDLWIAAESRLNVGLHWMTTGTVEDQESILALVLGRAIEACVLYDIPFTVMRFPDLVQDSKYCFEKLREGLPIDNFGEFNEKFIELANPDMIETGKTK